MNPDGPFARQQTMKLNPRTLTTLAASVIVLIAAAVFVSQAQLNSASSQTEKAVLARLSEIQHAAQDLDADKVFSFVLENDSGALAQNGRLFLTRNDALESTKRGFQGLQKVSYQFDQQKVILLSPGVALAIGEGSSSATTADGRTLNTRFAQTVVFVLTNGEWKMFHAHRSFPAAR